MQTKFYFSAILLSLIPFCLWAQSELVIEVTTDNYPNENHWVLYQINEQPFASSGVLLKETTHRDTFQLADNSCYYWTIYDAYGDGMSSAGGGNYKLYLDGNLIAESQQANFGDSVSVYNLGIACSGNDIKVHQIAMNDYISKDSNLIVIEAINMGNQTITRVEGWFAVNGESAGNLVIDHLAIDKGQIAKIAFPQPYPFDTPSSYTIHVSIDKVNGETDTNHDNNELSKTVTVVDGYVKKNLIEDFSSFECSFCPEADAAIEEVIQAYPETELVVKYTAWDFADTKYFQEIDELMDFYYVRGLPTVVFNGKSIDYKYFTPTYYSDSLGLATPVKLEVTGHFSGDSILAQIKLTSNSDIAVPLKIRGIVLENECFDVSLRYENNDPYYNIAYRLFNGFEGIDVSDIKANTSQQFSTALSIADFPFEEGSFNDMRLVFYLQNPLTREVFQSVDFALNYEKKPFTLSCNIASGSSDVDTLGLQLEVTSNRLLLDENGKTIANIDNHIQLFKNAIDGTNVPFIAEFENNVIKVTPKYGWEENSPYYFLINNLGTIDGALIEQEGINFTTRNYTGNNQKMQIPFQIFPNPAYDILNLMAENATGIEIFNLSGAPIMNTVIDKGVTHIDISDLPQGYYIIKIKSATSSQVVSFFKLSSSSSSK